MKRILWVPMAALAVAAAAHAQQSGTAARIVVWQPAGGQAREFEEGYKRHLEWHRANGDRWTWRGWMIVSVNVDPHADVRSLATYEAVPELTDITPDGLAALTAGVERIRTETGRYRADMSYIPGA